MAYTAGGLALISSVNGYSFYRYDSLDPLSDIDTAGYFNNVDDTLNLAVGDLINVIDWTTAVRTGTIADVGLVVVTNVIANDAASSAGAVNCSSDIYQNAGVSSTD